MEPGGGAGGLRAGGDDDPLQTDLRQPAGDDAAGGYHLLSLGVISPARRTGCEIALDTGVREPLTPGEPVDLVFSLTPAPVRLRPGERLRFDVASRTNLLRSGPDHGRARFDMPVPPYFSRNTLHFGPETYLEVSRVPPAPPAEGPLREYSATPGAMGSGASA